AATSQARSPSPRPWPRLAHLLRHGQALGLGDLACDVAALRGESDIQRRGAADLQRRLPLIAGGPRAGASRRAVQR
ncbi:ATP-dependent helicase HrpB, partial [Pseudomonas aeruginosa]